MSTVVVVPVRGRWDLAQPLLEECDRQGAGAVVVANTDDDYHQSLHRVPFARVLLVTDRNIHRMWNAGIEDALDDSPDVVAVLNSDVELDPDAIKVCERAILADDRIMVASPDTGGRLRAGEVEYTNRLRVQFVVGWAMFIRAEWLESWDFPESLTWYYGDTILVDSVAAAGHTSAVVGGVSAVHVDGGSQTAGNWGLPKYQPQLEADRWEYKRLLGQL